VLVERIKNPYALLSSASERIEHLSQENAFTISHVT